MLFYNMMPPALQNQHIILQPLTPADAGTYYQLYDMLYPVDSPFLPGETAEGFTARIITACNFIWSIRLKNDAETIIGDCALHDLDKELQEIEIGGSLFPGHQGKNIMYHAFTLILDFVKNELKLKSMVGKTKPQNIAAIKLVQKLGFSIIQANAGEVILMKTLSN
jgi:ribosomal-protein-alanine N-acetyltransferase